jgi:hypothetical protein
VEGAKGGLDAFKGFQIHGEPPQSPGLSRGHFIPC